MLFAIDSSLFVDDEGAGDDTYVREDSDDEGEEAVDRGGGMGIAGPLAAEGGRSTDPDASDPADEPPPPGADAGGSGASGADGLAAAAAAIDISDVGDASLFLDDEELPDDDEL